MFLSNLPGHLKLLLMFVAAAVVVAAGGMYGYSKMGQKNARLKGELGQLEQQKEEFQKLAEQLTEREVEFQNDIGDLIHLDTGLTRDEYVPTALEQFRLWASQNRLLLALFRPGEMVVPPPPPREEGEKGEKAFEAEVAEMLVGTIMGDEPWVILKKGKGSKEEPEYEVLAAGGTLTTVSGKEGIVKVIRQAEVELEYDKKPYTVRVLRPETESMKLELALEGSYEDFQRFLRSMNRFPKLVRVSNVSITEAGVETGGLRFRLGAQLFFLPEEVEKVLAEAEAPTSGPIGFGVGSGGISGVHLGVPEARPGSAGALGD